MEAYVKERLETELSAPQQTEPIDLKNIKKQFKRKRTQIPAYSNVPRYSPDVNGGLTDAQVNERFSQFLFNDTNQKYSKSYASILIGNLCTFFNLLCVAAAIAPRLFAGAGLAVPVRRHFRAEPGIWHCYGNHRQTEDR